MMGKKRKIASERSKIANGKIQDPHEPQTQSIRYQQKPASISHAAVYHHTGIVNKSLRVLVIMAEPAAAENSGAAGNKKRRVGESSSSSDTGISCSRNNTTDALLRSAKAFIVNTFQESSSIIQGGNKERWGRLDLDWKCDPDVAHAAINSGVVENLQSLPGRLRDD